MEFLPQFALYLSSIPPQLATLILAMVPIGELRGALPIALTVYRLPLMEAIFWSVIGNMIPVWFLMIFFEKTSQRIRAQSPLANRLLEKLYERTRRKLHNQVVKYGPWALVIFVGIPLPITGAWTGSLAAFVFGLKKGRAFGAIFLGVLLAAVIVAAITQGASTALRHIFFL